MHFSILLAVLLLFTVPAKAEPIDSIAAIVNNEAITCYDIKQDTKNILMQLRQSGSTFVPSGTALNQRSLDARVVKLLQLQEARKLDLNVGKEEMDNAIEDLASKNGLLLGQLKEALEQQGVDFGQFTDNLHDQLLISKLINISVRSKLQSSEESIREYYRKYLAVPKSRREVQLGHIFLALPGEPSPELLAKVRNKARNIHKQLLDGKDFAQLVAIYSESPDRQQQGVMGWFTKGSITQRFDPALELPVNGITEPVRSPSGFHILKVLDERWLEPEVVGESYDEVHARHILLQIPSMADEEERGKIKSRAEDIASEMQDASDEAFATRAKEVSQGPSSSRGGDLGWFKKGAMVPEFEKVVFAMKTGETSGVIKTKFGLHIIRMIAHRHVDPNSLQANRDKIVQILTNVEMQEKLPRWIASLRADANLQFKACPGSTPVAPTISQSVMEKTGQQQEYLPSDRLDSGVKVAIEQWRLAWSAKNIPAYFAAYSRHFNPGKRYSGIPAWKLAREKEIRSKNHIQVEIRNIKISHLEQGHARIEFNQHYRAGTFENHDLKLLLMEKTADGWKIIREMTAVSDS